MRTVVVLTTDSRFLVPTIGSAVAARMHISNPLVDVVIYVIDASDSALSDISAVAAEYRIAVKAAPISEIAQIPLDTFNKTHVPISTLARLWLDDILESHYSKFLYIDGDVDICKSLDPLLALPIPKFGFLAAPDVPLFRWREKGQNSRKNLTYLAGIGVVQPNTYFNAGVLLVDRAGWKGVASDALSFFRRHPERCRFHDQSALNAVAGMRRGWLSPMWNYQSEFMAVADPRHWGIEPAIWHFTGYPKPWHAPVFPWKDGFGQSFKLGAALLKDAEWPSDIPNPMSFEDGLRDREKLRFRLRWVYPWRRILRAKRIHEALLIS